jgi:hypothetical protein
MTNDRRGPVENDKREGSVEKINKSSRLQTSSGWQVNGTVLLREIVRGKSYGRGCTSAPIP